MPEGLAGLETWMLRVVTHPDGVDAGFEAAQREGLLPPGTTALSDLVPPNDRLGAAEQLHVYAFAYFDRLIDVLRAEYPTVEFLLGDDRFWALAKDFITEQPSRTYTLNRVGIPFAGWLAARAGDDPRLAFAVDLACVERAMDEVWDRAAEEPVAYEAVQALAPDDWGRAHLRPIGALELFELGHPVSGFMNGVIRGELTEVPAPEPAWVCVYCTERGRFRMPISFEQHGVLSALVGGATLGEAIEAAATAEGADVPAMLAGLGEWFRDWTGRGLFMAVDLVG